MLILYGSQTGTAQDVAESIWRDGKRRRIPNLRIYAMDDYEITKLITETLIVFVCSTTGQGDEPENMRRFWRFLCRRNLPSNVLSPIFVAVLGLGDSSYQKFNFAAKKLYRRLAQLGAKHLLPLGLADDQNDLGYDAGVESWTRHFWTVLESRSDEIFGFELKQLETANGEIDFEPKYRVIWTDENPKSKISNGIGPATSSDPFYAELIANDRMTHLDHFQDTRLIRFSIIGSGIDYRPGDVVYVQPKNLDESKTEFLSLLNHLDIDRYFHLIPTDPCFKTPSSVLIPSPCTFRQCAESYFDIQSIPRRSFFAFLAHFSPPDSLEKEKLLEFASSQGQEDYFSYCTRPRRTIVETMRDFPQSIARVPIDFWFDLISPIRPRAFSIASCLDTHPDEIQILMAVVQYKTRLYQPRLGLCSNFISRLSIGARVPIWVGKGTMQLPWDDGSIASPITPCIMIGPGTGVAPFRSYLHWRTSRGVGENILFFGSRNEKMDFYFRDEFESMQNRELLKLFTAFSRDHLDEGKKIYVQHRILEHAGFVAELIVKRGAKIFVAGSAKQMPKDVLEALEEILKNYFLKEGVVDVDTEAFLARMEKAKQLQMETWT